MSRETHVRFWEGLGVKFPRPTRHDLHWSLDVAFREDESRVRERHAQENMSMMRRLALSLLKQDTRTKAGIAGRRKKAGWDHDYLLALLTLRA